MTQTIALVVAAGRGHRIGGETPKQYREVAGRSLLRHCASALVRHPAIAAVRVVIHPEDRALYDDAVAGLDLLDPVDGGAARQDSVRLGLESLAAEPPDRVLIHDAARPVVDARLVERVIAALDEAPGAIPALPVSDSLKRADGDRRITGAVDRDGLWRAQTPQGFRFADLLDAHRAAAGREFTDDAAVAEAAGLTVSLVDGSADNIKVTTEDDFARAERLLGGRLETRVGMGFDVHAFEPGDHVVLCGVRIAHQAGLAGHSDADVGLHALVDAVLGALGAGDIGDHFPPSDPAWKGADSGRFAIHVRQMVADAGGAIAHLDVTLACEAPKLAGHRAAMVARVAELFGAPTSRVSVKATTTERLGFLGRGEGIAALAVATLRLPS